ncbi:hypothetical protein DFA_08431 [Cavenderia fasciculata]|uniref:EGF-like domain-containing protein n=1 Tax=Cavenderia fasciculata TaxID=261658 RepID=F4Q662_CACFS|nr:uncharacterized protein DFA_08431 [Cavenderia fasciculata]EGG17436.1 hypothetical protein DFA_08431 [Cavenderia fasciculata]|eukprot:XP_004355920.1 hypothetical protein DFA_08431 [Cavenderia fasciculata]
MMRHYLLPQCLFLFVFVGIVRCQVLPPNELNSAIWIIQNYGSSIAQNEGAICNSNGQFVCTDISGVNHITEVALLVQAYQNVGPPDANLLVFDFPEIKQFTISLPSSLQVGGALNILERTKNFPKLGSFVMRYDNALTIIPNDFPTNMPMMTLLILEYCAFTDIPVFFNNTAAIQVSIRSNTLKTVNFGQSLYLPRLGSIEIDLCHDTPQTWDFGASSFPALYFLTVTNKVALPLTIFMQKAIQILIGSTTHGSFHFGISNPSEIKSIGIDGISSTLNPPLSSYPKLEYLTMSNGGYTSFPFSQFPESLIGLTMTSNNFTSYPPIPASYKMIIIDLTENTIYGDIPWQLFNNVSNMRLVLDKNPLVTGSVPSSFCSNKLFISGTAISGIPGKNNQVIKTDIPLQPGFECQISFESTDLISIFGRTEIKGTNIGYGSYNLFPKISNSELYYVEPIQYGPRRNITIQLDESYPEYTFDFTILEVGFEIQSVTYTQVPIGILTITITFSYSSADVPHSLSINGTAVLRNVLIQGNTLVYNLTNPVVSESYVLFISNQYYNITRPPMAFIQNYPLVQGWISREYSKIGASYSFSGQYGTNLIDPIVYFNGNSSICNVTSVSETVVICTQVGYVASGLTNITVSVDGFTSAPEPFIFYNMETVCQVTTANCSGHGVCSPDGICLCNIGFYSDDCSKQYPLLTSGSYNQNDRKLITLYGDFGPSNQSTVTVVINETLPCTVTFFSQESLNCSLQNNPSPGLVSVFVQVNSSSVTAKNFIYFRAQSNGGGSSSSTGSSSTTTTSSSTTTTTSTTSTSGGDPPILECPFKCFGHGDCVNGQCQCYQGYVVDDYCLTKIINNTIEPNTTAPTTYFNIDGLKFLFEVVAVQEIDFDNNIVKEVFTNNWISSVAKDNVTETTTVHYQLNSTAMDPTTNVFATISFSNQSRNIPFGDQTLSIKPNSIKLSVEVHQWQYESILTTLRVIFKTTINNDQFIEYDCDKQSVDSLTLDQLSSSIQYLRVIKDNIQFTGRFVDYVLSDGRQAFSKTSLINQTELNQDESAILIGVSTPQCQSCILDPDFSPLLIDKSEDSGCEKKSNAWRIAVGVSVGGVALIAATIIVIKFTRDKARNAKYLKTMQDKLKRLSSHD